MTEIRRLERKLTPSDWAPESLFGDGGKIADIFGVMLKVPQLKRELEEIGGKGFDRTRISDITRDWVNGKGISDIARVYFSGDGDEKRHHSTDQRLQGDLPGDSKQRDLGHLCVESYDRSGFWLTPRN